MKGITKQETGSAQSATELLDRMGAALSFP